MNVLNRGQHNFVLAENFLESFPLSGDPETPTTLSMSLFDKWAEENGHYAHVDIQNKNDLNASRNTLRGWINRVGAGQPWQDAGNEPFQVEVLQAATATSETIYEVRPAILSFIASTMDLPRKFARLKERGVTRIDQMLSNVDPSELPHHVHNAALSVKRDIQKWEQRANLEIALLTQDVDRFEKQISKYIGKDDEEA